MAVNILDFLKSPSSCLISTRRTKDTSRDFVARSAASRPKQRRLRGLTYSTLKFMRSTWGKSINISNFAFHGFDIFAFLFFFFFFLGGGGSAKLSSEQRSVMGTQSSPVQSGKRELSMNNWWKNPDLDFQQELRFLALDTSCSWDLAPNAVHAQWASRRSIYQYFNMAPRLSGQDGKFYTFLLSRNFQKRLGNKENTTK